MYGKGISYRPKIEGKQDTPHSQEIYLAELLPLEEYDKIIVLFSGGKDSLACVLHLLELGVPKDSIELWHHDIDGGEPALHMDWLPTQSYCRAVAEYLGIPLRVSWRIGGFPLAALSCGIEPVWASGFKAFQMIGQGSPRAAEKSATARVTERLGTVLRYPVRCGCSRGIVSANLPELCGREMLE